MTVVGPGGIQECHVLIKARLDYGLVRVHHPVLVKLHLPGLISVLHLQDLITALHHRGLTRDHHLQDLIKDLLQNSIRVHRNLGLTKDLQDSIKDLRNRDLTRVHLDLTRHLQDFLLSDLTKDLLMVQKGKLTFAIGCTLSFIQYLWSCVSLSISILYSLCVVPYAINYLNVHLNVWSN